MRRLLVAFVVGGLIAMPVAAAVGSDAPVPDGSVSASDCPDAVAAMEAAGLDPVDTFAPSCPDPSTVKPEVPRDVLERDAACDEYYSENPTWCPSAEAVASAEARRAQ